MSTMRKLSLFVLAVILIQVTACRKEKKAAPLYPQTIDDCISKMVGSRKMVGYYSYEDPVIDTYVNLSETWKFDRSTGTSISVSIPRGGVSSFSFQRQDTSLLRVVFGKDTSVLSVDNIYYYYVADSIVYVGWEMKTHRTHDELLHSVR